MAQVHASYPGVGRVLSCYYTRTLGVLPNVASMRIVPQPGLPALNGTLIMGHGTTDQVEFPGCRLDTAGIQLTTEGHIERLRIFDRRVWWRFSAIDGLYNLRKPNGVIREETKKNAQQLASLLFLAMGETNHDVSILPADDFPFVHWECASARAALAYLCQRHGCDVDLDWASNTPRIVKLGVGVALPNHDDVVSVSVGADVSEVPGVLRVCCNYDLYQSMLKLLPVGIDTDGWLKRLKDLSYAPDPNDEFGGFPVGNDPLDPLAGGEDEARKLARKSVFRYWLVISQADGTLNPPGRPDDKPVTKIEQILPVREELVDTYDDVDSVQQPKKAFLSGRFATRDAFNANTNTDPCEPLEDEPFRLDTEIGLVVTDNPIVKFDNDNDDLYKPADLYLTCSYYVQHPDHFQYERYTQDQQVSQNPGIHAEQAPNIQRTFRATYVQSGECTEVDEVVKNEEEVTQEVGERLVQMASQFVAVKSAQVVYRSIKRMFLDGARRQITWSVSTNHWARTTATFNNEVEIGALKSRERLRALVAEDNRDRHDADALRLRRIVRKGVAL